MSINDEKQIKHLYNITTLLHLEKYAILLLSLSENK